MHFFCEHTNLPIENKAFGPTDEGTPQQFDKKFNIGASFDLTSSLKAFACQKGMMIVQQSDEPDLVNVIIKPDNGLNINFSSVKYYIFRGILKNSFVDGSGDIVAQSSGNTEFITRLWEHWNSNNPLPPTPTPQAFGYDTTLTGTTKVENIFNNSISNVRAYHIKEGEWIGDFGTSEPITFEIITDIDHLVIDLDHLKKINHIVDITGMPDSTPVDQFNIRVKREEILSYIDPAAFFGLHYHTGIKVSTYSGTEKSTQRLRRSDLYDEILGKFENKNRVYIDARSEFGYSYNFYQNFDDNGNQIKIKASYEQNFTERPYHTHQWPIIYDETTQSGGRRNRLDIQLRTDDNTKPLLFIRDSQLFGRLFNRKQFISDDRLINESAPEEWTNNIRLKFPNEGTGSQKSNVAHHIRLQYFRQENNPNSPNTVLKLNNFLDTIFAGIDLPFADSSMEVFSMESSSKFSMVKGADFLYVSIPEVHEMNNGVGFLTRKYFPFIQSNDPYPKISGKSKTNAQEINNATVFPKDIIFGAVNLVISSDSVSVIDIQAYNQHKKAANKEDLFILSLTSTEVDILKTLANTAGISDKHKRFIIFTNRTSPDIKDDNQVPYARYELNVQGLKDDGTAQITSGSGIYIYSLRAQGPVFNSKDAGDVINIPLGLPDAGLISQWNYAGKWEYDKFVLDNLSPPINPVVTIQDKHNNEYGFRSAPHPIDVYLRGKCFFPADDNSNTISNVKTNYPLIAIVHGNGHIYHNYDWLCQHLAKNGFFAASIDCRHIYGAYSLHPITISGYAPFTHMFRLSCAFSRDYILLFNDAEPNKLYLQLSPPPTFTHDVIYENTSTSVVFEVNFIENKVIIFGFNDRRFSLSTGGGMGALGRANLVYEHLKVLKEKFNNKIENKIALMGHSRGGEAVVRIGNEISSISSLSNINNLKSIISLAPTDGFLGTFSPPFEVLDKDIPYFVLYGSSDTDVDGRFRNASLDEMRTGFSLYDRAAGQEKSMAYAYKATHNGFITSNIPDIDLAVDSTFGFLSSGLRDVFEISLLDATKQKAITKAYMNAHFRKNLLNETYWLSYFTGEAIPRSPDLKEFYFQYERKYSDNIIIDFPSFAPSSVSPAVPVVGANIELNGLDPSFMSPVRLSTGDLRILDGTDYSTKGTSPHDTQGIMLDVVGSDKVDIEFSSLQDVSAFSYLSFRIANCSRSEILRGLKVGLKSGSIIIKDIHPIDFDTRFFNVVDNRSRVRLPSKNYLQTIRIPLQHYINLGINLTSINSISIEFPATFSEKVNLDNFIFTN